MRVESLAFSTMLGDLPMLDTASFRDPGGRVYHLDGRVFRLVADRAAANYEHVRELGLLRTYVASHGSHRCTGQCDEPC